MNLHEYQGKQLFAEYGLPVSTGFAVDTPEQAVEAADAIGGDMWVVKAQVHAGGRGKSGGVKLLKSKDEIRAFAAHWLGRNLVTYQTDEKGQPVSKILVETCTDIATELYLGAVVDRGSRRIVFMASREGGVEIETVAVEGHPADMLLAQAVGADLLVVGTRGHGGFASLLLGSISHQVAQHAPCPVAIVPHPAG